MKKRPIPLQIQLGGLCKIALISLFIFSNALLSAQNKGNGNAEKKLNVVMILADDLGWSDTTLYGTTSLYETPNIERLAERGMLFTNAYAASPLCSPTRASILTGQTPARHGITKPEAHLVVKNPSFRAKVLAKGHPGEKALSTETVDYLDTRLPTLGKEIQSAGYATGHFGKWHLGHSPYSPQHHGFDVDIPRWPGPGPAGSFLAPWKYSHYDNGEPGEHIEDRMAAEASKWMREQSAADQPYYLQYWQFSVHAPFDAKPELIRKYAAKVHPEEGEVNSGQRSPTYAAMVESLDDAVGTLLNTLDETGEADNTLIIFYSDNGGNEYNIIFERDAEGKGFLARPTDNLPLRGGKASIFDGGVRVPAIVVWPGVVEPGSRSDARIQSTDLYPTILDALGIEWPENHVVDGIDIRPALEGGDLERPGGMVTYFPHSPGVPEWLPPSVSIHKGDWKLIRVFYDGEDGAHRYFLYDLSEDIGETNNLAGQYPEKVAAMDALITKHLEDADAVVPLPNPDFDPAAYKPERYGVQRGNIPKLASFTMSEEDQAEANALLGKMAGKPKPADKGVDGWSTPRPVKLTVRDNALVMESSGDDPWAMVRFDPVDQDDLILSFELESDSPGQIVVFEGEGRAQRFVPGNGHLLRLEEAGVWTRFEIPLRSQAGLASLRIDPPGREGKSRIRSVRLQSADGGLLKSWFDGSK